MRKASTIDNVGRRSNEVPPTRASVSLPDPRDSIKAVPFKNTSSQFPPTTPSASANSTSPHKLSGDRRSDSRQRSKSLFIPTNAHKRSSSGNLLSRISFFRSNSGDAANATSEPQALKLADGRSYVGTGIVPFPITASSAPVTSPVQSPIRSRASSNVEDGLDKAHRRQDSLRKAALTTGNKLKIVGHSRSRSSSNVDAPKRSPGLSNTQLNAFKREHDRIPSSPASPSKRSFAFELPSAASSTEDVPESAATEQEKPQQHKTQRQHSLPLLDMRDTTNILSTTPGVFVASPISFASPSTEVYAPSTVSDSDRTFSPSPLDAGPLLPPDHSLLPPPHDTSPSISAPSSDSFPRQHLPHLFNLGRRRPPNIPTTTPIASPSPLSAAVPLSPLPALDTEHDYRTTALLGYVILILTWLVVVVGMGSCFGVWSWAWDVGATNPLAPPELEDDPTLPIVGYYPALMVLTAVMSWVWVTVAWVGMKYFKHAKIGIEE